MLNRACVLLFCRSSSSGSDSDASSSDEEKPKNKKEDSTQIHDNVLLNGEKKDNESGSGENDDQSQKEGKVYDV